MENEERDRKLYRYPNSYVLRNKLNIIDDVRLQRAERRLVGQRLEEDVPKGHFDLKHMQKIHKHLFQDVYAWAGKIREVDISKSGNWFIPKEKIKIGMQDVKKRLEERNFLRKLKPDEFAKEAGVIIGDINYLHPFREGNGRTQLQYLKQLGQQAGHRVDLTKLERESWINASKEAHQANYEPMGACIRKAIVPLHRSVIAPLAKNLVDTLDPRKTQRSAHELSLDRAGSRQRSEPEAESTKAAPISKAAVSPETECDFDAPLTEEEKARLRKLFPDRGKGQEEGRDVDLDR